MSVTAAQVVRVLADLADTSGQRRSITSVDPDLMRWLPLSYTNLLRGESGRRSDGSGFDADDLARRIFKTAKLRGNDDEGVLRVGWLWLAGQHPEHGRLLTPLVSLPVGADVVALAEPELSELITEPGDRLRLGAYVDLDPAWRDDAAITASPASFSDERVTGIPAWTRDASTAAGCATSTVVAADRPAGEFRQSTDLVVVAGVALYVTPRGRRRPVTQAATLRSWANQPIDDTALGALYVDGAATPSTAHDPTPATASPFELNAAQRAAVDAVARQRVTVLSGPPGTGKSQTVAAVAFDQVRRGRSVLVVAPTNASVSALTALMEQTPGPDPVVFGSTAHRVQVANQLTEHSSNVHGDDEVERRTAVREEAFDDATRRRAAIAELLAAESAADIDPAELMLARVEAPGLFEQHTDLDRARDLALSAADAERPDRSWWRRRRARKDLERLHRLCRSSDDRPLDTLTRHVELATARRRSAELQASGGLDLAALWGSLGDATDRLRHANGALLHAVTHRRDRSDRRSQRAVAAVAAALRAGRERRRELLAEVDTSELLEPLPLWVSTLRDVDDLLPMRADMFDLVIIDEASHIDQISAAPALLRASSALVVGDPRQLRHVSFVAATRVDEALAAHALAGRPVAAQLDVQRNSLFDAAASVQPPMLLDEHYRSAPHLIDFSAQRFYDGKVGVATRHPRNERDDCIDVVDVDGRRDDSGINVGEIDTIIDLLRTRELAGDQRSVGVITPFRAQADALEAALRDEFDLSQIQQLDLRVGTVHGFQGCQRDTTYLSMCLDDDAPTGSRSFVDDPALFNVMVTRARHNVTVVSSLRSEFPDLFAAYLRHADAPTASGTTVAPDARSWSARVVTELRDAGIDVRTRYPVGRHEIDAVVGNGDRTLGLICGVHPDGPDAHIDRHLELSRLGWSIREVFASQWADELPTFAVELRASLR
jgi:AAA domain